jgi:hypothetical protein
VAKLPRHLITVHKNEKEVIAYAGAPNAKIKSRLLTKLRNIGSHRHNQQVIQTGKGRLSVKYRTSKKTSETNYVVCEHCYGYFAKRKLWKHIARCSLNPGSAAKNERHVEKGKFLKPCPTTCSENLRALLASMACDDISRIVKTDPLILKLGEKLLLRQTQTKGHVRNSLREVGRLMIMLKAKNSGLNYLESFLCPSLFGLVVTAVREVCGFDAPNQQYKTPSLALKLGHTLSKCCNILKSEGLASGDSKKVANANGFLELYSINWSTDVSIMAHQTLVDSRKNTTKLIPLSADVQKLSLHLKSTIDNSSETLKASTTANWQAYRLLARSTLALVILFNRRRAGEVSLMKIDEFNMGNEAELQTSDIGLSSVEIALCNQFTRIEIKGKRGRTVPVLLNEQLKLAIDLLLSTRAGVGIPADNQFIFFNPLGQNCYRGSDCLREFSDLCGADKPQLLRSTKLRKHIAIMTQLVNLKDNELDILAAFMGHNIHVHREFYRLPQETIQVAKISKLLLALETEGSKLVGRSLEDIDVKELEEIMG